MLGVERSRSVDEAIDRSEKPGCRSPVDLTRLVLLDDGHVKVPKEFQLALHGAPRSGASDDRNSLRRRRRTPEEAHEGPEREDRYGGDNPRDNGCGRFGPSSRGQLQQEHKSERSAHTPQYERLGLVDRRVTERAFVSVVQAEKFGDDHPHRKEAE